MDAEPAERVYLRERRKSVKGYTMRESPSEDAEDRISGVMIWLVSIAQALFCIGLWLCAMKLIWWVIFVL